jgi:hypothetical protein
MGVLCGVQRYYKFSTLVDGDDFLLRIHIGASFEQVFFPQLTSTETNFNEKKKKKKPLSKTKKKSFAQHVWAFEMKTLWTILM